MPATIIVGGQYGSEGKGKTVALRASRAAHPWLVRCGGPNSGHTVDLHGHATVLRQVPSCAEPERAMFSIAAGCAIDESILISELDLMNIPPERILVDPRAVLVTEEDRSLENGGLQHISSTCSGNGAALVRRMSRRPDVPLVKDSSALKTRCRVVSVAPFLHDALERGEDVIIEGTQGFGLSLLHGPDYPFVTSRDTTAAGFAMEVGLSPRLISDIILVIRTFPIRVGGPSGPFTNEISWERVRELSDAPKAIPEYTSVTRKLRRVAMFDLDAVKVACKYNQPTSLAVMGLDRLTFSDTGITAFSDLSTTSRHFLCHLEGSTGVKIEVAGTGFGTFEAVTLATGALDSELLHA